MKKKITPELLKEELNKFKLLSEYNFYTGKNDLKKTEVKKDISEIDDDLEPVSDENDAEAAINNVSNDLGIDNSNDDAENQDQAAPESQPQNEPQPQPEAEPEQNSDEVEVDVTSIVKGSEDAKNAATMASQNTDELLKKFGELENRVSNMDKITAKIDNLEKELVKRNPTPVEKLEMRSLNSYPYSIKLTDFWSDKEGIYDVMNKEKDKEYLLTPDEINSDYSDSQIKQTFDVDNEYEEEDI